MSLVNFSESSLTQLKSLIGSFGNDELNRAFTASTPYVESRWFKVTEEVEVTVDEETTTEYKATEVNPDGTTVSAGIVFDSDATPSNKPSDPTYFKNLKINTELYTGSIEVNKAYQVEAVWPNDASGEIVYYIIPKGGGGGVEFYYAIFKNHEGNQIYTCDVYPDGLFNSEGTFQEDVLVKVFNVDYGEVLPNAKLKCWPAKSNSLGISYYSEAPTWQQDLP